MLSRPCETHDPADECVVTTVRIMFAIRKQFVQTVVCRPQALTRRNVVTQRPQARSGHSDDQRRFGLPPGREVGKSLTHELMTRKL
jgi:hypothetical protein